MECGVWNCGAEKLDIERSAIEASKNRRGDNESGENRKGEKRRRDMVKGVIFDLDGTLLDTLDDLHSAVNVVMRKMGFPCRTRGEVCSFIGDGVPKLIERALPSGISSDVYESALASFRSYYGMHCADLTRPYVGIEDMLVSLKKSGYVIAVVSNKPDTAVRALCDRFFGGLIDACRGQLPNVPTKPSPESVFAVMSMLGEGNYIYVGDSDVDILTAKNAELPCISVTWGFRTEEFLRAHGAECIISSTDELLHIVRENFNGRG